VHISKSLSPFDLTPAISSIAGKFEKLLLSFSTSSLKYLIFKAEADAGLPRTKGIFHAVLKDRILEVLSILSYIYFEN
jgi:hypothetical protein